MRNERRNTVSPLALAVLAGGLLLSSVTGARADAVDVDKLSTETAKSLVLVEYTYRNENASREESGQGIVLSKDGVVLISGGLIPESAPKDYIKGIKIRLPGKPVGTIPAEFLGRTVDRIFAYVKAEKPLNVPPLNIGQTGPVKLGQQVMSVALLGKGGGFEPYVGVSTIKAVMHMTHDMAITQTFGLTRATSPVFDVTTGALVGVTYPATPEALTMIINNQMAAVQIRDDEQSRAFLPWEEVQNAVKDIPTKAFDARRPWMGLDGLAGLEEDLREKEGIKQAAGVTVGAVVPGEPADKGGLQGRDIVLTMNGKEFSSSTVPELMVAHFQRAIEKLKIGDEVKLGVLRDGKAVEVPVKIGPSPKVGSEMTHVYNTKVGITTRDLVFGDAYSRKLPQDTKGVMVALVKQGGPAGLGQTPLRPGYLITRVNDQDVADQKQFLDLLKAATEDAEKTEVVFRVIRADGETAVCRIDLSK